MPGSSSAPGPPGSPGATSWAKIGSLGVGTAGLAYLAWRAYSSSESKQWLETLSNYGRAVASLSSSSALVARDLHAFLQSDATELPPSLRQLNRLLQSSEVQATLSSAAQAMLRGVTASSSSADPRARSVLDKVLEAILSDRGRSLVGMAMGIATKNATAALCDFIKQQQEQQQEQQQQQQHGPAGQPPAGALASVMRLLSSEQGERLLSLLVTKSMKTAVSTYVEATTGYNTYEDLLSSISKQDHRDAVASIMSRVTASFCQEVALAIQRANSGCSSSSKRGCSGGSNNSSSSSSNNHTVGPSPLCPPPSTLTPSSSLSSAASSSSSLCDQADQHTHTHGRPRLQARDAAAPFTAPKPQQDSHQESRQLHTSGLPQLHGASAGGAGPVLGPAGEEESRQGGGQEGGVGPSHARAAAPHAFLACSSKLVRESSCPELGACEPHTPPHQLLPAPPDTHPCHPHAPHQHAHPAQLGPPPRQQPRPQQQQQQQLYSAGKAGSPSKPAWVRRVVELVREQEVRALCLDVVTSATREATRSTLDSVAISIRASLPSLPACLHRPHAVHGPVPTPGAMVAALIVLCFAVCVWRLMASRAAVLPATLL